MLLLILWRLVTACSILLGLYMLYFGAVALFGFKKRRAVPRTAPKTRFACVAAARNEEAVIANLVHSLRRPGGRIGCAYKGSFSLSFPAAFE